VTPTARNGHGNGNGNGAGKDAGHDAGNGDDFEPLIRDRDDDFEIEFEHPRAQYDPYADFTSAGPGGYGPGGGGFGGAGFRGAGFNDRGLVEAITRIIEALASAAGDALAPEARHQLEKTLRDLLVALRDSLNWIIERIDERQEDDFEIEEIPID
jgi:hypothetical protein